MKNFISSGLFFILLFSLESFGQNTGKLSGTVLDKLTQKPIGLASITLSGTKYGTITDTAGNFRLNSIPVGTYNVEAAYIGYRKQVVYNIIISAGNENNIAIEIEP